MDQDAAAAPARIGRFRIVGRLGGGGMGEVYRGEDLQLGRPVAIKLLRPDVGDRVGDRDAARRLLEEARAASAINHPGVVAIYEVGETDSGPFVAMELVDGEPLDRLPLPLPVGEAVAIGAQVADALAEAHGRGVLHRDLKPSNLIRTPRGRVKVLDFGLAKRLPAVVTTAGDTVADPLAVSTALQTAPGQVIGTLPYMSPEQLLGRPLDVRTDLFSLGVVLFELLSGQRPFRGETPLATMAAILGERPPRLDALRPELPPSLIVLIDCLLARDPEQRPENATAVADELARIGAEVSSGTTTRPRLDAGAQAHLGHAPRRLAAALAIVGLAALLGWLVARPRPAADSERAATTTEVVDGAAGAARTQRPERLVVLPITAADDESSELADGITEALIDDLGRLPGLAVLARSTAYQLHAASDLRAAAQRLGVTTLVRGDLSRDAGGIAVTVELLDAATGAARFATSRRRDEGSLAALPGDLAIALGPAIAPGASAAPTSAVPVDTEAYRLYLRARRAWAQANEAGTRTAIALLEQALDREPTYAAAHAALAAAYGLVLGDHFMPPTAAMPRAEAAAQRALVLDPTLAEAELMLGVTAMAYHFDPVEAERRMRRAIALQPSHAFAHHQLGWLVFYRGRGEEALAQLRRAQELDPLSPPLAIDINVGLRAIGDGAGAIAQCKRAISLDPAFFLGHFALGWELAQEDRFAESIAALEAARGRDGSPMILSHLGYSLGRAGRVREARAILAELAHRAEATYVPPFHAAIVHLGLGELDAAFAALDRSVAEHDGWLTWLWRRDPWFEPLWADPRHAQLLASMAEIARRRSSAETAGP